MTTDRGIFHHVVTYVNFFRHASLLVIEVVFLINIKVHVRIRRYAKRRTRREVLIFLVLLFREKQFLRDFNFDCLRATTSRNIFRASLSVLSIYASVCVILLQTCHVGIENESLLSSPISMEGILGKGATIFSNGDDGRHVFFDGFFNVESGRARRHANGHSVLTTFQIFPSFCAICAPARGFVKGDLTFVSGSLCRNNFLADVLGSGQVFLVQGSVNTINYTFLSVVTTGERIKDRKDTMATKFLEQGESRFRGSAYQSCTTVYHHRIYKDVGSGKGVLVFLIRTGARRIVNLRYLRGYSVRFLTFIVGANHYLYGLCNLAHVNRFRVFQLEVRRATKEHLAFLRAVATGVREPTFHYTILTNHGYFRGHVFFYPRNAIANVGVFVYSRVVSHSEGSNGLVCQLMRSIIFLSEDGCFSNLYSNGLTFLQRVMLDSHRGHLTTIGNGQCQLVKGRVTVENDRLVGFVVPNNRELQRRRPTLIEGVRNVRYFQIQVMSNLNSGFPNKGVLSLGANSNRESGLSNLYIAFFGFRANYSNTIIRSVTMDLSIEKGRCHGIQSGNFTFLTYSLVSHVVPVEGQFAEDGAVHVHNGGIAFAFLYHIVTSNYLWMGFGSYTYFQTFSSANVKVINVFTLERVQIRIVNILSGLSVSMGGHFHRLVFYNVRFRFVRKEKYARFVGNFVRGVPNTQFSFPSHPTVPTCVVTNRGTTVQPNDVDISRFTVARSPVNHSYGHNVPLNVSNIDVALCRVSARLLRSVTRVCQEDLPTFGNRMLYKENRVTVRQGFFCRVNSQRRLLFGLTIFSNHGFLVSFVSRGIHAKSVRNSAKGGTILANLSGFYNAMDFHFSLCGRKGQVTNANRRNLMT